MPTPNASRWNIGGSGSPTQNSRVGHVDFMLFVSLSLALGSQREYNFQWNMGFTLFTLYPFYSKVNLPLAQHISTLCFLSHTNSWHRICSLILCICHQISEQNVLWLRTDSSRGGPFFADYFQFLRYNDVLYII